MLNRVQFSQSICNPMDCSLPGFSIHEIFPAGILEWVAISSSRGSSQPRDWTWASCIGKLNLYHWAPWEAPYSNIKSCLVTLGMEKTDSTMRMTQIREWGSSAGSQAVPHSCHLETLSCLLTVSQARMHRLSTARSILWASRACKELQSQVSDSSQQKECSQRVVPKVSSYFLSSGRTSIQMILSSPAFGKIQPGGKNASCQCSMLQHSSQPHVETEPPSVAPGKAQGLGASHTPRVWPKEDKIISI